MQKPITIVVTRLQLRVINFAMTATFWLNRMHYATDTVEVEHETCRIIQSALSAAESELDLS